MKSEKKGKPGYRWEEILEWNIRQPSVEWFELVKDRVQLQSLVNMVMNAQVPQKV